MTEPMPEPPVDYAGCPWPVDPACLTDIWEGLDPAIQSRALALASSTLERLTAYRVQNCPVTVRPCAPRCAIPQYTFYETGPGWINPSIASGGIWINGCGCRTACACSSACEIDLPGPVGRVDQILVDGQEISLDDVRIDDGHILVWEGGGDCPFNVAQDLSLPDSEVGTFSITYLNAYPVDMLGAQAAGYLAVEFAKACAGKGKCSLPRNVTEVVRNGVSFTIEAGLFPAGRTGIDVVDAFIEIWNPQHRTMPSKVWTPGRTGRWVR